MSNTINPSVDIDAFLGSKLSLLNDDLTRNSNAVKSILSKLHNAEDSSLKEILEQLRSREEILIEKITTLSEEKQKLKQNVSKECASLLSSHRLLLLIVLFGSIIIATSVFYAIELVQTQTNEILKEKTVRLNMISTQMENDLIKMRSIAEASSRLPQVQDISFANLIDRDLSGIPFDADPQKREVANDILRTNDDILSVFFVLPNGDMYLSQPYHGQENIKDYNFAFRDWYKGVSRIHATYTSELYNTQINGDKTIAIATPVYSNSEYVGIWCLILDVDHFGSSLQRYLSDKSEQLLIIDQNQNVIYDSFNSDLDDERITKLDGIYVSDDLSARYTTDVQTVNDIRSLVLTNPIHNGNDHWRAIMVQPYDDALPLVKLILNPSLLATGIFIVIVLILCVLLFLITAKKSKQIQKNIGNLGDSQNLKNVMQDRTTNQNLVSKSNRNKKVYALLVIAISMIGFNTYSYLMFQVLPSQTTELKSGFVIENLRGDTIDTWVAWNVSPNRVLDVHFVNPEDLSAAQLDSVKSALLSEESVSVDDSVTHKGPQGYESTYYAGWVGALKAASNYKTKFIIPTVFHVSDLAQESGDILFHFSKARNVDGYTGYTNSIVDKNQILKATITIYDVDELTPEQIGTIARHEFGHAIGLAHSTAPEDLMAPIITTTVPYVSECNISAIQQLYDNNQNSSVVCEK